MSANGRLFRSHRGALAPADDAPVIEGVQVGREVSMRVIGDERVEVRPIVARRESDAAPAETPAAAATPNARQHVREAEDRPAEMFVAVQHGTRKLFGRLDRLTRQPELETWAEGFGGGKLRVFSVNSQAEPNIGAATDSHSTIVLNSASSSWGCPIRRLATLRHEVEHVIRGDAFGGWSAEEESECDKEALEAISGLLALVDRGANAAICQSCYTEARRECRQGEGLLAQIFESFARVLKTTESE
jgi:hypothetical protein